MYITRLVAKTRRDDVALLARLGPLYADDDAELLRSLYARWPLDYFDQTNIATEAPYNARMKRALGFLGPRVRHHGGGLSLSAENERDVWRWLLTIAGRELDGLRLTRDVIGWCEIAPDPLVRQ
jgi:hypothetical protein